MSAQEHERDDLVGVVKVAIVMARRGIKADLLKPTAYSDPAQFALAEAIVTAIERQFLITRRPTERSADYGPSGWQAGR